MLIPINGTKQIKKKKKIQQNEKKIGILVITSNNLKKLLV